MESRGQAFTLESITASLLLVSGLVFALQATAVTPLSASTSSQHIENQQQAVAEGVLANGIDAEALRVAVLNWNGTQAKFAGASERYFVEEAPSNEFGDVLSRAFTSRLTVFNVNVYYRDDNQRKRQRMVYRGNPSDNAVSASSTVTLYDDDPLYDDAQEPATTTETHTYSSGTPTNILTEAPVVAPSAGSITDASGDVYVRKADYTVVDGDGDGKPDTVRWDIGGGAPSDGETFTVTYTPAISKERFYAPDHHPGSGVYSVVEVEVIAWRQ